MKGIAIFCADGLTGSKEAISAAFPKTEYQHCIVHQVRNTLKYVSDKDRKPFCADLKTIYPEDHLSGTNRGKSFGGSRAYDGKMGGEISKFHEDLKTVLGRHLPDLQVDIPIADEVSPDECL